MKVILTLRYMKDVSEDDLKKCMMAVKDFDIQYLAEQFNVPESPHDVFVTRDEIENSGVLEVSAITHDCPKCGNTFDFAEILQTQITKLIQDSIEEGKRRALSCNN